MFLQLSFTFERKKNMNTLLNILKGMVIGVSNVIPGVSGGTMAVVLGIYDKLITTVNSFFKDWKKSLLFLLQIGIGAVLGIILFSKLITLLLNNYAQPTQFFFIGLILGSFPLLYKRATKDKAKPLNYLWFILALGIMIVLEIFRTTDTTAAIMTTLTFKSFISLFGAGFIAAATMILPGVSGSLVLLILGLYTTFTTAVSTFNIPLLIPIGLGVLTGIITMTKVIEALLRRFPQPTYFAICGLILGSIFSVYPGFSMDILGFISVITFAFGFGISLILGRHE